MSTIISTGLPQDLLPAVDAVASFADRYGQFAALVGQYKTTVLPQTAYDSFPGLQGWAHAVRDAYAQNLLTESQVAMMEALVGWTWKDADRSWLKNYRDLEQHVALYPSEGFDLIPARNAPPVLLWAREQQLSKESLAPEQITALELLNGWVWSTRCDRVAALGAETVSLLRARGETEAADIAVELMSLPDYTLSAMLRSSAPLRDQVDQLLAVAERADVRESVSTYATLIALAGGDAAPESVREFFATHLDEVLTGEVAVCDLSRLSAQDAAVVVAVYAAFTNGTPAPAAAAAPQVPPASAPAFMVSDDLAARHVASLGLSVRTYNVLMREGLHRVGDLLSIEDPQQLLTLRGFGVACLDNLRDQLLQVGAVPRF